MINKFNFILLYNNEFGNGGFVFWNSVFMLIKDCFEKKVFSKDK